MRYRLLPYLYSLAHRAHRTGAPLLSGVEAGEPEAPDEGTDAVFLLGDALLFSPVTGPTQVDSPNTDLPYRFASPLRRRVWAEEQLSDGDVDTRDVPQAPPREIGYDSEIRINSFNSSEKNMSWGRSYFVVWDGVFTAPEPGWYRFRLLGNGRKELRLDGEEHAQLRAHFDVGTKEAILELPTGEHPLEVSFSHSGGGMPCIELAVTRVAEPELEDAPAGTADGPYPTLPVYLPAGRWRDLWSGAVHMGPCRAQSFAGIRHVPAFVRCGSVVPLTRVAPHTTTAYWDHLCLEVFPHQGDGDSAATIVFDDGESTAYLHGRFSEAVVNLTRRGRRVLLSLRSANVDHDMSFTARFHLLPGDLPDRVLVDDVVVGFEELRGAENRLTPIPVAEDTALFPDAVTVVVPNLSIGSIVALELSEG